MAYAIKYCTDDTSRTAEDNINEREFIMRILLDMRNRCKIIREVREKKSLFFIDFTEDIDSIKIEEIISKTSSQGYGKFIHFNRDNNSLKFKFPRIFTKNEKQGALIHLNEVIEKVNESYEKGA